MRPRDGRGIRYDDRQWIVSDRWVSLDSNLIKESDADVLEHGNRSGLFAYVVVDSAGAGDKETASRIEHRVDCDDRHASFSGGAAVRTFWNQSRSETGGS